MTAAIICKDLLKHNDKNPGMDAMFENLAPIADSLSKELDSDFLLVSGPIDYEMQDCVIEQLKERTSKKKNLTFLLCTPGGSADAAYRISRAFQDQYETVTAYISGWCKSAGTLCVIGANNLVMTDEAELGPLDVQISRRDEIGERDSGLVVSEALKSLEKHAFSLFENFMLQIKTKSDGAVSFKMAADVSALLAGGLLEPIYRQIDPEKLGATARSLAVAYHYGKRLNIKAKNLKSNALGNLGVGYPSHGFVIDRREAAELFIRVRKPTELENKLSSNVGDHLHIPSESPVVHFLNPMEKQDEQEKSSEIGNEASTGKSGQKRKLPAASK